MDTFADIYFSDAAKRAIRAGITRGDSVADMEAFGMPLRIINILEDSEHKIVKLSQLVSRTQEELMGIECLGEISVRTILEMLARYHELDDAVRKEEDSLKLRTFYNESLQAGQPDLRKLQNACA